MHDWHYTVEKCIKTCWQKTDKWLFQPRDWVVFLKTRCGEILLHCMNSFLACLLLNSIDFLQLGASIFFISTFIVFVWIFRECFCMNRSFNRTNGHIQKPKALNVGFNFILCEKKFTRPSFQTHYFISSYRSSYQNTKKNKTGFIYTNAKIKPHIFNLLLKKDRTRKIINTVHTKCKLEALLHFLVTWEKYIEKTLFEEIFDWKTAKVTT